VKVYHKSTCVTCKRTISELERAGADLDARDFFRDPFTEAELKKIMAMAKISPREMLRKRDRAYKEMGLDGADMTDGQLVRLMVKNPGLIRRPIIVTEGRVAVGRVDVGEL